MSGAYSVSKHVTPEKPFQGHSPSGFLGGAVPVIAAWPLEQVTHLSSTQPSSLTIDGGRRWWRHMLYILRHGSVSLYAYGLVSGGGLTIEHTLFRTLGYLRFLSRETKGPK